MKTSFFFFAACRRMTSVPWTLVSIVMHRAFNDQLHADGGGQMEDHAARSTISATSGSLKTVSIS